MFEADKTAIEQVVDARREKKAVLPVEPLFVRRVPPRLAMAGDQVGWVVNLGDAAALLNRLTRSLKSPCPRRARMRASRSVAMIVGLLAICCSSLVSHTSKSSDGTGKTLLAALRDYLSLIAYKAD